MESTNWEYDAFIAYSHNQEHYVDVLKTKLSQKGFKIYTDYDIVPGHSIIANITKAIIYKCKRIILVLSDDFITSTWTNWETELAIQRANDRNSDIIIPILYKFDAKNMPAELKMYKGVKTDKDHQYIDRIANSLKVPLEPYIRVCPNNKLPDKACLFVCSFKDTPTMEDHLQNKCDFRLEPCSNGGCIEEVCFKEFQQHCDIDCPYKTINCDRCQSEFHPSEETHHESHCPEVDIECPNRQCHYRDKRAKVAAHKTTCIYNLIPCKNKSCNVLYCKKDKKTHKKLCSKKNKSCKTPLVYYECEQCEYLLNIDERESHSFYCKKQSPRQPMKKCKNYKNGCMEFFFGKPGIIMALLFMFVCIVIAGVHMEKPYILCHQLNHTQNHTQPNNIINYT